MRSHPVQTDARISLSARFGATLLLTAALAATAGRASAQTRPAPASEDSAQRSAVEPDDQTDDHEDRVERPRTDRPRDRFRALHKDRMQREPGPGEDRHDDRHDMDHRDRDRFDRREPTTQEWGQTVEFLREHAPRRLQIFRQAMDRRQEASGEERVGEDGAPQTTQGKPGESDLPRGLRAARARIFWRVRMLEHLQDRDASLYEFALRQFELEDQIIAGLQNVRQARQADDEAAEAAARDSVQQAVRQYVENTFAEREARIDRLREQLAHEQQRLEEDRQNVDELTDRLRERFERSLPDGNPGESRDWRRDRSDNRSGDRSDDRPHDRSRDGGRPSGR